MTSSSSPGTRRSQPDGMAATEFNIARIKEIQSKFAKGEVRDVCKQCSFTTSFWV